jgi:hypothetical protein
MRKVHTLKEAASATGLTEWELRQGAKSGKYPAMRAGGSNGKLLFDVELLEQAIIQHMMANTLPTAVTQSGTIRPVRIAE